MTVRSREIVRACFVAVACAACCLVSAGSDPPDSELNPVSGKIETIDTSTDAGNHDVRFVSDPGDGYTRATFMVTADPLDDLGPRLSVTNGGDTWVVWWRDGEIDTVLARKRTLATGVWSDEVTVGEKLEGGRKPEILHDGATAWVAYELDDPSGDTGIAVSAIHDDPDPIGSRDVLATTAYGGDRDLRIEFAAGQLWVSWVDGASEVGWSEYDPCSESWGTAGYEFYAADDVEQARGRIRTTVLAN